MVSKNNPKNLTGYKSIAKRDDSLLAIIRDQFQHRTAIEFGVPKSRIKLFETYDTAANTVQCGLVDAYASVGRAHSGYLGQSNNLELELVVVPNQEKEPAFGCFAFHKTDKELRTSINQALKTYLGSEHHRSMYDGNIWVHKRRS